MKLIKLNLFETGSANKKAAVGGRNSNRKDSKLYIARLQAYLEINLIFLHVKYTGTFKKVTHAPCLEVPPHKDTGPCPY